MRRLLTALLVLACVASGDAQKFQFKRGKRPVAQVVPASIALTNPVTQTTGTSISPTGTTGGPIASVTWSNATTGQSGTASGVNPWSVTASATLTVAQDLAVSGSDAPITSRTPPVGSAWACPVDSSAGANPILAYTGGYFGATASDASGSARFICLITPASAITGTNYDISAVVGPSVGGSTDGLALIFGYVDTSNYCALAVVGGSVSLTKTVSGTASVIGTPAAVTPLAGQTLLVEVRGTSLTAKLQGVTKTTATTTDCDNGAGVGIGVGSFRGQTGQTEHANDTFSMTSTLLTTYDARWAEVVDTCAATAFINASDRAAADNNANGSNCGEIYTFTPSVAIGSADYTISASVGGTTGSTSPACIGGRYVDASNWVAFCWYGPGANPDTKLIQNLAGVTTTLDTADCAPATGHVYVLTFSGSTVSAEREGSACVLDATTGVLTTGKPFIGWGNITGTSTDDASLSQSLDNFIVTSGSGGDTISLNSQIDSLTVVDQDASTAGIPLNVGANVITYTATPTSGTPATVVQTVTRGVSDTQAPTVSITIPSTGTPYTTGSVATNIGGDCGDNQGVAGITISWASPTTTPASGTTSCVTGGTWSVNNIGLTAGAGGNDITVTATDAAMLTATDVIKVISQPGDVTDPTISISAPNGGSAHTVTSAVPLTISGVAGDNNALQSGAVTFVCANHAPSSGTAVGTTAWSFQITPVPGTGTCTVTVHDAAARTAIDSIDITYSAPLAISTTTLAGCTQNASCSRQVTATGGTTPYTAFDNNSGGSSLGAAACTGLSITLSGGQGLVSGTPTTTGTCSFTAKVTDTAPGTDTQALSILIQAPGSAAAHDYYDMLCADGNKFRCVSFRSPTAAADCASFVSDDNSVFLSSTCNFAGDTNPEKIEGLKTVVRQWGSPTTLVSTLNAPAAGTQQVIAFAGGGNSTWNDDARGVMIDDEVLSVVMLGSPLISSCTAANPTICTVTSATTFANFLTGDKVTFTSGFAGETPNLTGPYAITRLSATTFSVPIELTVAGTGGRIDHTPDFSSRHLIRGAFGTSTATHASGAAVSLSVNSLDDQVNITTSVADGRVRMWTIEGMHTSASLHAPGVDNWKFLNIRKTPTNPYIEPQQDFTASSSSYCPNFNPDVHIGGIGRLRLYTTNVGPGVTGEQPLLPFDNSFCSRPNKIIRWWIVLDQRAGVAPDYDLLSMWVADEDNGPTAIYTDVPFITNTITRFNIEMNTSVTDVTRSQAGVVPSLWRDLVVYWRDYVDMDFSGATWTATDVYNAYIAGVRPIR